MFSGIVEGLVSPVSKRITHNEMLLTLPVPKGWKLTDGESISVDGICSTITHADSQSFSVYYMPETMQKTHLLSLPDTHAFNLERSLRLNSLVGGHLVSGHIDAAATVRSVEKDKGSVRIVFALPSQCSRYIIYKGSICVNGVSLTVVAVDKSSFSVSLIPYTLQHTNLGKLKKGDRVNIEVDMLAKYLEKLLVPV